MSTRTNGRRTHVTRLIWQARLIYLECCNFSFSFTMRSCLTFCTHIGISYSPSLASDLQCSLLPLTAEVCYQRLRGNGLPFCFVNTFGKWHEIYKLDKICMMATTLHSNLTPFAFVRAKFVANCMKGVIQSGTSMSIHERNSI